MMIILSGEEGTTTVARTGSRSATWWWSTGQRKQLGSSSVKGGARRAKNWPNFKGLRLRCFKIITIINNLMMSKKLKRQPRWTNRVDLWSHRILSAVQLRYLSRIGRKHWYTETKLNSSSTRTYRLMSSGSMTHQIEMMANLSSNKCIIIRIKHSRNHSRCLDD